MAASIKNHQYRLEPRAPTGVCACKPRSDSPVRGFNNSYKPPEISYPQKNRISNNNGYIIYSSSDDDDGDEKDGLKAFSNAIEKGKAELEPSLMDSRDEGTADNWIQRNPSLVRLTGKHPFNCEPPLTSLMHHGFITPVPLHYVRNHGSVPKASWEDWTVEVSGLVKRPTNFTMNQLLSDFPSNEFPVTLVCAGNRRKEQNMIKQTIGFNWGAAGVSTSVWRGVPLRAILKRCGVLSRKKGALNVCFEGAEDLPGGGGSKYATSIQIEMAMDPSRDIILAYMQNSERLAPDHGFPVRLIIPGFIGGRMVKWLKRITVTSKESDNYYHYNDNRVLPSHVDAEVATIQGWWYKPEYIINDLNINSVITSPCHEEILPLNGWTTPYTIKGYSYSGGGRKVTRTEVTLDGGETWKVCKLSHLEKPNKYGKYWCWCFWSLEVEVTDIFSCKDIAVRAWDESLNTQPEKLIWNVMGMMNNCWFRVKKNVCRTQKGEVGLVFEHPTQPGNQSGGWMAKERHLEISSDTNQSLKKSVSSPFMNTATQFFSMSEVKRHKSADSAWIIVHGHVYDCTSYLEIHPGGVDSILIYAGTDCTEEFDMIHSDKAKKLLEEYRIGELITTGYTSDLSPTNSVHGASNISHLAPIKENVALVPGQKVPCKLISKTSISHDVRKFRFALPHEDQVLGLPVGKHVFLSAMINGNLCMRAYTPTSGVDEVGFFELVVKIYFKGVHTKFPNGGHMSQYLDSLAIGSYLDLKGPVGHIEYTGKGNFLVNGKHKFAKKLAMLAGGTGITPMYQTMKAMLRDPEDDTEMYLVYANRTEDDILLRDELDAWAEMYPTRVKVWYVVQETIKEGWKYNVGFITENVLREHIPGPSKNTVALACGPPPMIKFAVTLNLERIGYNIKDSLLVF